VNAVDMGAWNLGGPPRAVEGSSGSGQVSEHFGQEIQQLEWNSVHLHRFFWDVATVSLGGIDGVEEEGAEATLINSQYSHPHTHLTL
jgi:hypothetical protein